MRAFSVFFSLAFLSINVLAVCVPPTLGDWIITENCTFSSSIEFRTGDIRITNGGVLTVTNTGQMALDLKKHQIYIEQGGHMRIQLGGKVISGHLPDAIDDVVNTPANSSIDINVLAGDFDSDLNHFSIESFEQATHGSVTSLGDGFLRYTPQSSFAGVDSFSYTIVDSYGLRTTANVLIAVGAPDVDLNDYWKPDSNSDGNLYYNGDRSMGIGTAQFSPIYKLFIDGNTIADEIAIRGDAVIDGLTTTQHLTFAQHAQLEKLSVGNAPTPNNFLLSIDGKMLTSDDVVAMHQRSWPDFVFERDYALPSLKELEAYIKKHKHLPDIQPATIVEKEGINLGESQSALLQKIEELSLYLIKQNKKIKALEGHMSPAH